MKLVPRLTAPRIRTLSISHRTTIHCIQYPIERKTCYIHGHPADSVYYRPCLSSSWCHVSRASFQGAPDMRVTHGTHRVPRFPSVASIVPICLAFPLSLVVVPVIHNTSTAFPARSPLSRSHSTPSPNPCPILVYTRAHTLSIIRRTPMYPVPLSSTYANRTTFAPHHQ